jgi:hypothetical protein
MRARYRSGVEQTVRQAASIAPLRRVRAVFAAALASVKDFLMLDEPEFRELVMARVRAEMNYQRAERDFYRPL